MTMPFQMTTSDPARHSQVQFSFRDCPSQTTLPTEWEPTWQQCAICIVGLDGVLLVRSRAISARAVTGGELARRLLS